MDAKQFIIQLMEANGGQNHGRVQLQKLIYFCKAMGVKVDASYRLYVYGPFSQQVANALQDCVSDQVVTECNGSILKGENFNDFLESANHTGGELPETAKKIVTDILTLCRGMTTRQMEITATAFFIDRQQKVLFGNDDRTIILDKVTRAKGSRFTEEEIAESYQQVVEKFLPLEKKYST